MQQRPGCNTCNCDSCRLARIEEKQDIIIDVLHGMATDDNDALLREATARLRAHRQPLETAVAGAEKPK